ncbi:hypothetical protein GYMLUDRAFT_49979 [Collybiopsis luxurians FD-317 M1]|uniref:Uncharacterized protein n=1 Tax=Collybiopsis luxurians FD-317 M1 TaxID=944289 RepID=A0A0D0BRX8_9AGAR|nr:hypothetical protein GYMLUDRAFT_49979 [Collybiopsis luxurians FD-317 M1]
MPHSKKLNKLLFKFEFPTSQLKKLINQVVLELDELGLGPDVLHKRLGDGSGEVLESFHESSPDQLSVGESEKRLKLVADRPGSVGRFLELNMFILNVKKLEQANAEATCKIRRRHAKRTALPLSPSQEWNEYSQETSLVPLPAPNSNPNSTSTPLTTPFLAYPSSFSTITSLLRILVQALGTTRLPIVSHIDDYSCINRTNIALESIKCNAVNQVGMSFVFEIVKDLWKDQASLICTTSCINFYLQERKQQYRLPSDMYARTAMYKNASNFNA